MTGKAQGETFGTALLGVALRSRCAQCVELRKENRLAHRHVQSRSRLVTPRRWWVLRKEAASATQWSIRGRVRERASIHFQRSFPRGGSLNVLWKHSFSESRTRPLCVQWGLGAGHPKFGEVLAVGSLRACVAFMSMGDGRASV